MVWLHVGLRNPIPNPTVLHDPIHHNLTLRHVQNISRHRHRLNDSYSPAQIIK